MNPEAIEWLENLSEDNRYDRFTPICANEGLFQLKDDHEMIPGRHCRFCDPAEELVTVG